MLLTRLLRQLLSSGAKSNHTARAGPERSGELPMDDYQFTQDWFSRYASEWQAAFAAHGPVRKLLEVGSYEGRSTVWLIENAFPPGERGEVHCIDSWQGGFEHSGIDMGQIEARFRRNIEIAKSRSRAAVSVHTRKGQSFDELVSLHAEGHRQSFDVVYVDGSHQCADVLGDLILCFALCRVGGMIIIDDYLWSRETPGEEDLLNGPKLAVDSFVNCYRRKLKFYNLRIAQIYLTKIAE